MTYLTRAALLASGLTDADIRGQIRAGTLHRVGRGRFTRTMLETPTQKHLAMARQETGILGLESAALLHGLAVAKVPALIQLIEPASSNIRRRQDKRVWGSRVTLEEIVTVQGVRCTSVPWTLLELGRRRAPVAARIVWESAFNRAHKSRELQQLTSEIDLLIPRLAKQAGVNKVRTIRAEASHLSESPMETRSLILILAAGLPAPVQQFSIHSESGSLLGRADFAWPELGVLGEYDGESKYQEFAGPGETPLDVLKREKQRQAAIERLGWTFVRWGKDQLSREGALIELLREAMARAAKRPLPTIHPPQTAPDWIPEEPVLWS